LSGHKFEAGANFISIIISSTGGPQATVQRLFTGIMGRLSLVIGIQQIVVAARI
jgi:hypothetical protein